MIKGVDDFFLLVKMYLINYTLIGGAYEIK